jgi:hypothetical protein
VSRGGAKNHIFVVCSGITRSGAKCRTKFKVKSADGEHWCRAHRKQKPDFKAPPKKKVAKTPSGNGRDGKYDPQAYYNPEYKDRTRKFLIGKTCASCSQPAEVVHHEHYRLGMWDESVWTPRCHHCHELGVRLRKEWGIIKTCEEETKLVLFLNCHFQAVWNIFRDFLAKEIVER